MPLATASEKITLNIQASHFLRCYQMPGATAQDKAAWAELCCAGPWARKFVEESGQQFLARMVIAAACARVYSRVSEGGPHPIFTTSEMSAIREDARSLRLKVDAACYFPVEAKSTQFREGLNALCDLHRADTPVIKSRCGDGWKRWATLELGREMLRAFKEAPSKIIADLLGILWGAVDDSWVRKILTASVVTVLRLELDKEQMQAIKEDLVSLKTEIIINSMMKCCTAEQKSQSENFHFMALRLSNGLPLFENDNAAISHALEILAHISDPETSRHFMASLQQSISDYGLN